MTVRAFAARGSRPTKRRFMTTTKFLTLDELRQRAPSTASRMPHPGVSSKYTHVNTLQIAEILGEMGWHPVRAREQMVRDTHQLGFQKHEVVFRHSSRLIGHEWKHLPSEHRIEMDNADEIFELIMTNSHNRTSTWQLRGGISVQICANGLVISRGTLDEVSIPHVNITRGEIIGQVQHMSSRINDVMLVKDEMKQIELPETRRMDFAERALLCKYHDLTRSPVTPKYLLEPRRDADRGNSLWKTYQVIQENTIRGGQRESSRLDNTGRQFGLSIPVTGIDRGRQINQELWDMAVGYMNN